MELKHISKAVEKALKEKKLVKFTQSVEMAINVDVDFKKPENRVNLDIQLPHQAKQVKVAVFADGQLAVDAKKYADIIIPGADIAKYAQDKKLQRELTGYSILASTLLMPQIGKSLGQFLGMAGKLPKPIMPNANLQDLIDRTKKSITLKSKGKYLPTLNCIVGKESMTVEELAENAQTILESLNKKVPETQVKSIYLKTTMGKAVKIEAK